MHPQQPTPDHASDQVPRFTLLSPGLAWCPDASEDESLLSRVTTEGPVASIWQTQRSLVVPRSYRRYERFEAACAHFQQLEWPVSVRQTGGGIVPQGPGILNLSLAYGVQGPPMQHSESGYKLICAVLAQALGDFGIDAFPAAVQGSFCDGRYNLAVRHAGDVAKIAGTAQSWRRRPGSTDGHVGLVHALVLLDVDTKAVTEAANSFEAAIGSTQRYQADKVVSITELLGHAPALQTDFVGALAQRVVRVLCPGSTLPVPSISDDHTANRRTSSRLIE